MAQENDIVLIYMEDNPLSFARIEKITADYKRDWYHVTLLMLLVPLQVVTWILKNDYINGDEFTMKGKLMRLERVVCPPLPDDPDDDEDDDEDDDTPDRDSGGKKADVISFRDLKKK